MGKGTKITIDIALAQKEASEPYDVNSDHQLLWTLPTVHACSKCVDSQMHLSDLYNGSQLATYGDVS